MHILRWYFLYILVWYFLIFEGNSPCQHWVHFLDHVLFTREYTSWKFWIVLNACHICVEVCPQMEHTAKSSSWEIKNAHLKAQVHRWHNHLKKLTSISSNPIDSTHKRGWLRIIIALPHHPKIWARTNSSNNVSWKAQSNNQLACGRNTSVECNICNNLKRAYRVLSVRLWITSCSPVPEK